MEFISTVVQVGGYIEAGRQPAHVFKREGRWLVRDKPIGEPDEDAWALAETGEFVRIPLFPYLTNTPDASSALGYAMQLGFSARVQLEEMPGSEHSLLHVAVGTPVDSMEDASRVPRAIRFWLGYGVRLG